MLQEHPSFKKGRTEHHVIYIIYNSVISVENKGKLDLKEHLNTEKHKHNTRCASASSSVLEKFIVRNKDVKLIRASEGMAAYHNNASPIIPLAGLLDSVNEKNVF